jgi:O-methyltransferase
MTLPATQLVSIIIIVVLVIIISRYIWGLYFRDYVPKEWLHALRTGKLDPGLVRMKWGFPDKPRFYCWWFQVERLKREGIPGAFAELGVYRGDSARVLHRMDPMRTFHLFDTFMGFPPEDLPNENGKARAYTPRDFADTSPARVMKRISGNSNIVLHPGHFPETARAVENEVFALVNIDADLYLPTSAGLRFFYLRLSPGGVIFIHDYNHNWEGLMRAVDEFSATIPECFVQVPDIDSTVMLIRNK